MNELILCKCEMNDRSSATLGLSTTTMEVNRSNSDAFPIMFYKTDFKFIVSHNKSDNDITLPKIKVIVVVIIMHMAKSIQIYCLIQLIQ